MAFGYRLRIVPRGLGISTRRETASGRFFMPVQFGWRAVETAWFEYRSRRPRKSQHPGVYAAAARGLEALLRVGFPRE
jgi:hypothetical protein